CGGAAVAVVGVAVVALFLALGRAVAAGILQAALARAAVAARGVAVVALLDALGDAVAAGRFELAGGGASVAAGGVAVVAGLAGVHLAVAARAFDLAGGGAAVAARRVAVVALLARVGRAVAADGRHRKTWRARDEAPDRAADGRAEEQIHVREPARQEVAVAHDRAAARRQRLRPRVAARFAVVA